MRPGGSEYDRGELIEDVRLIEDEELKSIFIMAQAGAGKTSLLRHLATKMMERLERHDSAGSGDLIPMFIRANQLWVISEQENGLSGPDKLPRVSLESLVLSALTSVGLSLDLPEGEEVAKALRTLIKDAPNAVTLLIDALDEVTIEHETRNNLRKWIEHMQKAVGNRLTADVSLNRVIVSSRPNVFRHPPKGLDVVTLEPMDNESERSLVQRLLMSWKVRKQSYTSQAYSQSLRFLRKRHPILQRNIQIIWPWEILCLPSLVPPSCTECTRERSLSTCH